VKKVLVLAILLFMPWITDCGVVSYQRQREAASETRKKLKYLEVGMTKQKVEDLLFEPYKVEMTADGIEYWLYVTEVPSFETRNQLGDSHLTPVVFREGKVIGWGRNFYKTEPNRMQ
jgi:hypothetical protein